MAYTHTAAEPCSKSQNVKCLSWNKRMNDDEILKNLRFEGYIVKDYGFICPDLSV